MYVIYPYSASIELGSLVQFLLYNEGYVGDNLTNDDLEVRSRTIIVHK